MSKHKPMEGSDWETEMDAAMSHLNWYSCICCSRYRNNLKPLISHLLETTRNEVIDEALKVLTDEIVISHTEGGLPTARLTSSWNRVNTLKK